jgi:hypothetical protein
MHIINLQQGVCMKLHLVYGATRTRDYTGSMLDLVNDMFVLSTSLQAVCLTPEERDAAVNQLITELKADHSENRQVLIDPTVEQHLKTLWRDAIMVEEVEIENLAPDADPPSIVYAVFEQEQYRAWGGGYHAVLATVLVSADHKEAQAECDDFNRGDHGMTFVLQEMPVRGLPEPAEPSTA